MKTKQKVVEGSLKRQTPAMTPEGREDQMIAYAVNLAEEQLRNGTASSLENSHVALFHLFYKGFLFSHIRWNLFLSNLHSILTKFMFLHHF